MCNLSLSDITYPVFILGKVDLIEKDGVVLIPEYYRDESDTLLCDYRIVDDKNIDKPTLSLRRIYLLNNGVKLKRLNRAVFFLGDLIKMATKSTWLIDYKGVLFKYRKEKRVLLTYKKITKVIPIPTGGAIVEISGVATRFKSLFAPLPEDTYAGVLKDGKKYILYGFFESKYSDSWRKI